MCKVLILRLRVIYFISDASFKTPGYHPSTGVEQPTAPSAARKTSAFAPTPLAPTDLLAPLAPPDPTPFPEDPCHPLNIP